MATLFLKNLTKLQANKLTIMFEEDNDFLDYINDEFKRIDLPKIEVNGINYDPDGDNEIIFSELNDEDEDDE